LGFRRSKNKGSAKSKKKRGIAALLIVLRTSQSIHQDRKSFLLKSPARNSTDSIRPAQTAAALCPFVLRTHSFFLLFPNATLSRKGEKVKLERRKAVLLGILNSNSTISLSKRD
jgi:hypothetical protein